MAQGKITIRSLTCKLTADERSERAMRSAQLTQSRDQEDEARKASASAYKAAIDRLDIDRREAARAARDGHESRSVECSWSRDDARALMLLFRHDTEELIESRAMTTEERQMSLPRIGEPLVTAAELLEATETMLGKRKAKKS